MYSNLGGLGPDTATASGIRYANVGTVGGYFAPRFDLVVTNLTAYTPDDVSQNGISGYFAQINFAANSQVLLRVQVFPSCCTKDNCLACDVLEGAREGLDRR